MSEVCDKLCVNEKLELEVLQNVLYGTHTVLKHEIKTGILAQLRVFEYLINKLKNSKDVDFKNLLELGYEVSKEQYVTVIKEIKQLESTNLDNSLCLT